VSIKRWAARTDSNQSEIVSALRAAGCDVWIIGLPVDLLVGKAGRTALMEVKTTTGKRAPKAKEHTPLQSAFMAGWRGGMVATVTDVDSALRVAGILAGCIGADPLCPCQDGLACHYRDAGGTKALNLAPARICRPNAKPETI
jgi:hypothetical protein